MQSLHSQMPRGVPAGHCPKKRKHQPRLLQSEQSVIRLVCRFMAVPGRGAFLPHSARKSNSDTSLHIGGRSSNLGRLFRFGVGTGMQGKQLMFL